MRKYGKWLLVLGILAANPAWVSADGLLSGIRQSLPMSKSAQQQQNQEKAEEVARALQQARINGYDLSVEVSGNAVKLDGKVRDVTHRALAEQSCREIPGIEQVVNNLRYAPPGQVQQTAARVSDSSLRPALYEPDAGEQNDVRQVHFQKPGKRTPTQTTQRPVSRPQPTQQMRTSAPQQSAQPQMPAFNPPEINTSVKPASPKAAAPEAKPIPVVQQVSAPLDVPPAALDLSPAPVQAQENNQEVAQQIAMYLAKVGLVGYDVEIRYENGVATLNGDVGTVQQMQAATFAASQVDAVRDVNNNLRVKGPIAQTSFGGPGANSQVRPAAMTMPPAMMMAAMQAQQGPTAIAGAGNYSNPNLPDHAWPAYAAYPNSAAVNYPQQYSASAFPYIGPFYPYPQVPLGWREVSLQWDDGHWQIDFEKKHKAWYWLYHPKNWY